MHEKKWMAFLGLVGWLALCPGLTGGIAAQEETHVLGHEDVLGKLQRPPVAFPHDRHMDALEEEGCGVCHHVFDEDARVLVPVDDPENGCTECHGAKKEGHKPALRQAFHGSCNVCHRKTNKSAQTSRPVTCGECHKRGEAAGQER